jgi:D-beta-D-heptose 7-phosphate kinase/D-beta-D-heptose 1-phosphate adenosyltransferase
VITVWTNGCFDLLHAGHVRSLQVARQFGDRLIVGVNDDESVRRLKGWGRPVIPLADRVLMLRAIRVVDDVVVIGEDPSPVVESLRPDVIVKGADWRGRWMPEADVVRAYGGRVEFVDLVAGLSTSEIIRRIQEPLMKLNEGLAERVAAQCHLLTRKAEGSDVS